MAKRRLVIGLSPRRLGFYPRTIPVGLSHSPVVQENLSHTNPLISPKEDVRMSGGGVERGESTLSVVEVRVSCVEV